MPTTRNPSQRAAVAAAMAAAILAGACSTHHGIADRGPQAYYQTAHPIRDKSHELERIFRSVMRIQVTGYYRTYRFTPQDSVTDADLRSPATYRRAAEQTTFDHTRAGTATIISRSGRSVSLVTNEHVTRLPDTVVAYFGSRPGAAPAPPGKRYVESVAIRASQRNLVIGLGEPESFRVLTRDSTADVALIGVTVRDGEADIPVLNVRRGDPSRLSWGSFVYVLGYPRSYRMVTRAIVSDPNRSAEHAFLLDGLFNRGISGGLILAVRGDTEELEWVGMAMAASAQHEFILLPDDGAVDEDGMLLPYDGRLHIERVTRIDYGITFSVPMTTIRRVVGRSVLGRDGRN